MEIFGKEFNMNTNVSPKEAKLSLIVISIVVIVILSFKLIVMPFFDYKNLKETLKQKNEEVVSVNNNLIKAQKKLLERQEEFNRQEENYFREKEKFENKSLKSETDLKYMVTDIAEYLDIKIIEVGSLVVSDENGEYIKKTIPYRLEGDSNKINKFFYYLENSNYLITFTDSNLEIKPINKEEGEVSVRMEISAYFSNER